MGLKVFIKHEFERLGLGILIADINEVTGKIYVANPVELEWTEVESTTQLPTTLHFPGHRGEEFLSSLKEVVGGSETKELSKLEALKATQAHLEDLRCLVFNKQPAT